MAGRLVVGSDLSQPNPPVLSGPRAISTCAISVGWQAGREAPALDLNVFTAAAGRYCRAASF
jgi:hypothetical protein